MTTPEGRIKRKVDSLLRSYGDPVWFFSPQAGPYGRSGVPDRIACVNGTFVGIECKADSTKKTTRLQENCLEYIRIAGGVTFIVCDDETLAQLKQFIENGLSET